MRRALVFALSLLPAALPAQDTAQLARTGLRAVATGEYTTAVYFLKQVVAAEPRHPSAWKELCRAYLELDRLDAAIDACLKQIDVHPDAPQVYEILGRAYWKKGKRDEAVSAFQQQIEVDPKNSAAHGDLGRLYRELGRSADALPELEKAVAMQPETVDRAALGGVYLDLGQTDKGWEILAKLAQDTPSPGTWNSVAYALASHKLQLERAERYAESAVTMVATNLRNVELDHIAIADLRRVVSLAAYWDTLGWVHFQRGNTDEAEKFIGAAWSLDPKGRVADHMGQLYASRGHEVPAIAFYARAMAPPDALPETRRRLEALWGAEGMKDNRYVVTRPAGKLLPEKATADFYLLQAPKPAEAEARFIRGDERLRPFAKAVQDTTPAGIFPDTAPTKLIRRVTLTCPGEGRECSVDLPPASEAVIAELASTPPDTQFPNEPPAGYSGVTPPVVIYKVDAQYSKEASKKKIQGTITVEFLIDPTGHPRNIEVTRGLGYGLDEKAIEAVGKWRFRPGTKEGEPVYTHATSQVTFRLLKDH
jgi:TonB family protein